MTQRACPVCAHDNAALYRNAMAPLDNLDMSYTVASCSHCGFGYAAHLPPAEDYSRYYTAYSKYDLIHERSAIPTMVRAIADGAVEFLAPHLSAESRVFDIGCSVGVFLDACQQRGFTRVSGVDPAPAAAALAQQLFGISISTGFFDGGQSLRDWDLVSLIAVLEHLWSPQETFAALGKAMRPGALLYIEVPAGDRFGELDGEAFGEFSLEHVNFFGAVSLRRLAARHGFSEVACSHCYYPNQTWGLRSLFRLHGMTVDLRDRDLALVDSLQRYVEQGQRQVAAQNTILADLAATPLAIYGAGSHTARVLAYPAAHGLQVRALVDGNANLQGKQLGGLSIAAPETLAGSGLPVLIASYHARQTLARIVTERYGLPVLQLYPQ